MDISTVIGGFIGIVIVVVISALVISLLIWLVVLVWKKLIFPMLNKSDDDWAERAEWEARQRMEAEER